MFWENKYNYVFWRILKQLCNLENLKAIEKKRVILEKFFKIIVKNVKKKIEICLIVGCTISRLLIDYFYKNRFIGFKEIID